MAQRQGTKRIGAEVASVLLDEFKTFCVARGILCVIT